MSDTQDTIDAALTLDEQPPPGPPTREQRADMYAGRYYRRALQEGSDVVFIERGATGAVLHVVHADGQRDLTSPDEMERDMFCGFLERLPHPDDLPPAAEPS